MLVVKGACREAAAAEISVVMSDPPRYRGPVIKALLPQTRLPVLSTDGALTAQLNVALLLVSPSLSTPPESARRSVWPLAGRNSEHVSSLNCSVDWL